MFVQIRRNSDCPFVCLYAKQLVIQVPYNLIKIDKQLFVRHLDYMFVLHININICLSGTWIISCLHTCINTETSNQNSVLFE